MSAYSVYTICLIGLIIETIVVATATKLLRFKYDNVLGTEFSETRNERQKIRHL